jgi:prevent-host-death family protein
MAHRTIPQRELRNDIGRVLREAEAGTEFLVTVRGRPVARLGPAAETPKPAVEVSLEKLRRVLAATPVDDAFASDLRVLREDEVPVDDPWPAA